ncbi:RNA-directed DNA polymerase, eukaryota, reverse transcriptase zinc-binding domain protein [Tanacetum coccineum]
MAKSCTKSIPYIFFLTNPDEKLVANKENVVDSKENNSYVEALSKNLIESDNKLFSVPTSVNEKGEEVVIFDEELVNEGTEKWKFTGKYGLRDIVVDNDVSCYAKFKDEESMNLVLEQSPWMVNGRPFIVQKWDHQVTIVKSAPCKIPVWIKLFNVPLEAWRIKGISTLSSRLGRPIIMDKVTADMCNRGIGWLGYARVLVEIEAGKGFLDEIEINYYLGIASSNAHLGQEQKRRKKKLILQEIRGRGGYQGTRIGIVKTMFVPKVPAESVVKDCVTNDKQPGAVNQVSSPRVAKLWKVGKDTMEELKRSANKYAVLAEVNEENNRKNNDEIMIDKRLIVDEFLKKKQQPSVSETKDWSYDMIKYFKYAWEAREKGEHDDSDEEDVEVVYDESVQSVIANEVENEYEHCWSSLHPVIMVDDFKSLLKPEEHLNGGSASNMDMHEFSDLVNAVEVEDLCSSEASCVLFTTSPYLISDHSPGVLIFPEGLPKKVKSFRFTNYIADKQEFLDVVAKGWETSYFMDSLQVAQEEIDKDPFNEDKKKKAITILEEYTEVSKDELKLLHQKAKINWLREGDKNTAYFHNILKARKHKNIVESIQELLRGYNKKQGAKRCAMKIDINWIMICISTASFSICINGEVCEYFKGGRGLRLGDPMSPYLFTLVMEVLNMIMIKNIKDDSRFKYHYGCKELKLTHLCFADDLLMLCNGDVDSLKVMKKSLEEFSKVSGLFPNHSKSTIFFGSMLENKKQELLEIMPFKYGKLPMKYLGVPLLSKRLWVNDCKCLIEFVERRIKCWRNRVLSYAGRIQLIASVLASMQNY